MLVPGRGLEAATRSGERERMQIGPEVRRKLEMAELAMVTVSFPPEIDSSS
jgi:hypothetical protein